MRSRWLIVLPVAASWGCGSRCNLEPEIFEAVDAPLTAHDLRQFAHIDDEDELCDALCVDLAWSSEFVADSCTLDFVKAWAEDPDAVADTQRAAMLTCEATFTQYCA